MPRNLQTSEAEDEGLKESERPQKRTPKTGVRGQATWTQTDGAQLGPRPGTGTPTDPSPAPIRFWVGMPAFQALPTSLHCPREQSPQGTTGTRKPR